MPRILFTLLLVLSGWQLMAQQNASSALFSYDEDEVAYLIASESLGDIEQDSTSKSKYEAPILGINSFWWGFIPSCAALCGGGCVAGAVAVGAIYYITGDAQEARNALYGCIIGQAVPTVIYFTVVAIASY